MRLRLLIEPWLRLERREEELGPVAPVKVEVLLLITKIEKERVAIS